MISILPGHLIQPSRLAFLVLLLAQAASFATPAATAQSKVPDLPVHDVPVFVNDFELDFVGLKPKHQTSSGEAPQKTHPGSPPVYEDSDVPSAQARRLTDFFTASLLQALTKRRFSAVRGDVQKPAGGAQIRGVFAEPDGRNRIRRALLGSSSPSARFYLYVGIFNLARQEQPLYELAPTQSSSERYGPVITLNAYIPLRKYELDKNPSEEDVRKICEEIVASLTGLLEKNPSAFAR